MTTVRTNDSIFDIPLNQINSKMVLERAIMLKKHNEKKECHKIEDLPEKYQKKVNEKLLTETIGGRKGTHEEVKQRLVDKYYNQWQQERKQENTKKHAETKGTKNKEHNGFAVPEDVAKMQNDVQFIKEQFKAAERRHHSGPLIRPYRGPSANSFFDEKTAKLVNNKRARTSQKNINTERGKSTQSRSFM